MGTDLREIPTINVTHDDKDLVQLAGYHAYKEYEKDDEIQVNGKVFLVEHVVNDPSTGLDALTVRNITPLTEGGNENHDGELIIVYVGSDQLVGDWINTNINLIGETEPAQLEAAVAYFDYIEEELEEEISSVTGNSLGGALANRIAIDRPDIKAVTLNPAMLPKEMVDPNNDYSNITNYQSEYDILTHVQQAIKYDDRVPGMNYHIKNGLPIFSAISSNHKGYVDKIDSDADGNFTIEIGSKNEPGHGFIHVGADDHIVTSIWTGAPLHGFSSVPIRINLAEMFMLADGLKNNVAGRLMLAGEYIENAVDIVNSESEKFNLRISKLQETLHNLLNNLVGDPLFRGISGIGNAIKTAIDGLISLLDLAEEKTLFLNSILNSAPAEVIESIFSLDISVETLINPVRKYLEDLKDKIDQFIEQKEKLIKKDIPAIFKGGKDMFVDAVVGELDAHYNIVHKNKVALLKQVNGYGQQVQGVAEVFENLDHDLSVSIQYNTLLPDDRKVIQAASNFCIPPSPYLERNLKLKEIQVEIAHSTIKRAVTVILSEILSGAKFILLLVESGLDSIIISINTAVNVVAYSPIGLTIDFFSNYIQKLRDAADDVKQPILDMQLTVDNLIIGIQEAMDNLPEVLDYFKEHLDNAIFKSSKFRDLQLYNIASTAILYEMEMLFNDIVLQLSNQRSNAIEGTISTSKSVLNNIRLLRDQVESGTV